MKRTLRIALKKRKKREKKTKGVLMALVSLVDGNNVCYRHNAVMALEHNGIITSAIYGVMNMLKQFRLSTRYHKEKIMFFWDMGHAKERIALYPDYKKKEESKDPDEIEAYKALLWQLNFLRDFVPLLGCYSIYANGYECDDLLAEWCAMLNDDETGIMIISGDHDYEQLLCSRVSMLSSNTVLTDKNVEEKRGVRIDQLLSYYAMVGDSSDHIPGIGGIGHKRAQGLLECIPELANGELPDEFDSVPNDLRKYADKLRDEWDIFERNRQLMQLPSELVRVRLKDVTIKKPARDKKAVKKAFQDFGFISLLTEFEEYWAIISGCADVYEGGKN